MIIALVISTVFGWFVANKFTEQNPCRGFGGYLFKLILAILWPFPALLMIFDW
jgi:hypothetical protein